MEPGRARYPLLFSPLRIGTLTIPNRIALAPMASHMADHVGTATDASIAWYVARARGGAGLIISESNYVRIDGRGGVDRMGLHVDERIAGHRRLVKGVHDAGVPIIAQLHHAGLMAPARAIGQYPVSASTTSSFVRGDIPWVGWMSRKLATHEVKELVVEFGNAACRAVEAGFDGIQVHGAHGYLIQQFLSPLTNQRDDQYGGSPENRARFLVEIVREVRRRIPPGYPLMVRISGSECSPGGYEADAMAAIVPWLEAEGTDMIDISAGRFESYEWVIQPQTTPEGALLPFAEVVKRVSKVPVGIAGRLKTPEYIEQLLREGKADLINIGRQLIADADWARKVLSGEEERIVPCIACNRCIDEIALDRPIICAVNPRAGRETTPLPPPPKASRRVMVIGGGVAGLQAAVSAAGRGHKVTLHEATQVLGGQALLAGLKVPHYYEIHKMALHLAAEAKRLGVDIRMGSRADAATVEREKPDALIVATGAVAERPASLPGAELPNVVEVLGVLAGSVPVGKRVVVVGGGLNGACVGEALAVAGHEVTMVKESVPISAKAGILVRKEHTFALNESGVRILAKTKVLRIVPEGVMVEQFGEERLLPADTVVLARGMEPVPGPVAAAENLGIQVFTVGDAVEPREVLEAVHEGYRAGSQV